MHHKNKRLAGKTRETLLQIKTSVHHPEALQHVLAKGKGRAGEQKFTSSLILIVHKSAGNYRVPRSHLRSGHGGEIFIDTILNV
jgi:hypothetical protein